MSTIEAPPVAALTAEERYHRAVQDRTITILDGLAVSFAVGVAADRFHENRRLGLQRLDARQAVDLADEVAPRAAELREQERALVEAEQSAIAESEAELRAEFTRRLAEAQAVAKAPLADFKMANAAEQSKLSRIFKAAADGRDLLLRTADPKIDEAIERLERAESAIWGPFAVSQDQFARPNLKALERRQARDEQIEALKAMKLRPECFEHAASNPWRTIEAPGEDASGDASS